MNPKLQDCIATDDYREAIQHALVTKTETVATDVNIMVVHSTVELFGQTFADSLPEDGILLDKEALKSISKATFFDIEYLPETKEVKVVHSVKDVVNSSLFKVKYNVKDWTFPTYMSLFNTNGKWEGEGVTIGLNPKLFARLAGAMGCNPGVSMTLSSPNRAIIVRNTESSAWPSAKGLIMPMMLDV